jgi:hypothetical protein
MTYLWRVTCCKKSLNFTLMDRNMSFQQQHHLHQQHLIIDVKSNNSKLIN